MIEDVYEPLGRYRDEFEEKFASLAREKFAELTAASGIDVGANRALAKKIHRLEAAAGSQRTRKLLFGLLIALGLILIALGFVGAVVTGGSAQGAGDVVGACVFAVALGIAVGIFALVLFRRASARLAELERKIEAGKLTAWEQMAPLNDLYTWDIPVKLIEATVPRLAYDPYFTVGRLDSLRNRYGWSDAFNDGKSIVFAQSGEINGNPFVFGQYLEMTWGEKTYVGTKTISWTEWETDAEGRRRRVTRHETLHAQVTKPIPVYTESKVLVYGNDAAGNLSFSREPSGLDNATGLWGKFRKYRRLRELRAFSRNLKDESQFTLMANEEFETWFHAKDRDDEVEFRLLFTPIAQTQMLLLMKDRAVGYGDDFTFVKRRKVNLLASSHLDRAVIDTDPERFHNWDYDAAKKFFLEFNARYFKDAYFAFAPLLAIPLYQQTRTHEDIWREALGEPSSFWEHESIANYYGEELFRHPACVTRSLLKTRQVSRDAHGSEIEVTSHGYRSVDRVDCQSVYGGDGRWHEVEIPWKEYLPVERSRILRLTEGATPAEEFGREAESAGSGIYRRSILSYLA